MQILVLDDDHYRLSWFTKHVPSCKQAETAQGIIDLIVHNQPCDELFLDHDLGGMSYVDSGLPNTGMGVVRWIVNAKPTINRIVVHTLNHFAGKEMCRALVDAGYTNVERINFIELMQRPGHYLSGN